MRILVVDDDPGIRRMLGRFLKENGFEHALAADTAQTMTALETGSFDAVLLDVVLGAENGWETLRALRERWPVPVAMFSGALMDADSLADAHTMGAQEVLQKPFEKDALLACLRRLTRGGRP